MPLLPILLLALTLFSSPTLTTAQPTTSSATNAPICACPSSILLIAGLSISLALSLLTTALLTYLLLLRKPTTCLHELDRRQTSSPGEFEKTAQGGNSMLELSVERHLELGGKGVSELGTGSVFQEGRLERGYR
jgi:hypothetical protein